MSEDKPKIAIVEARYYQDIADNLANGVIAELEKAGYDYERIEVPGVFEIPAAVALAMDSDEGFVGAITLGCVIRGETSHYDHICQEASRALMDLTLAGVPLGFGVLTVENRDQAVVRADPAQKNKGAEAATACMRMIALTAMYGGE